MADTRSERVVTVTGSNGENPDLRDVFDSAAHYFVKMSGDEFALAWNAGRFHDPDPDCHPGVVEVASLAPFGILTR